MSKLLCRGDVVTYVYPGNEKDHGSLAVVMRVVYGQYPYYVKFISATPTLLSEMTTPESGPWLPDVWEKIGHIDADKI